MKHYRARAAQSRALAATMKDPKARKALLSIAADFDEMAETWERLSRGDAVDKP